MKQKIIIVAGPTASGKTSIGIELANALNGEIVSADSMQIYKGLDINTAKATSEEKQSAVHHMLDIVSPSDEFSVTDYVNLAEKIISDIISRGKVPIIVGGTGMYIRALLYRQNYGNSTKDDNIRQKYQKYLSENGIEALHNLLKEVDPISASEIHPNNTKRVIRALEIYAQTGKSKSSQKDFNIEPYYDALMFVLDVPRDILYDRINKRVNQMVENGGLEEARHVYNDLNLDENAQCLQAIGYKEFLPFLRGEKLVSEVIEDLAKSTRHYAKRQLTYFRGFNDAIWVNPFTQKDFIIAKSKEFLC